MGFRHAVLFGFCLSLSGLAAIPQLTVLPAFAATGSDQADPANEKISIPGPAGLSELHAVVLRPPGPGPFRALVALHDCDGLFDNNGAMRARYRDWAAWFVKEGFAVIFPDSYGSRSLGPQCRVGARRIRASRERTGDARAAQSWLAAQKFVDAKHISLFGWSNGASAALTTIRLRSARDLSDNDFRAVIGFYPNCVLSQSRAWSARVPTLILMGAADDWNSAKSCRQMVDAAKGRSALAQIIVYPKVHHEFDRADQSLQERHGIARSGRRNDTVHVKGDAAAAADARKRILTWLGR